MFDNLLYGHNLLWNHAGCSIIYSPLSAAWLTTVPVAQLDR
jgi:hypothetical protein